MDQYTLTHIVGTRTEALFCGGLDKRFLVFWYRKICIDINTDFFHKMVDYLNDREYRVS